MMDRVGAILKRYERANTDRTFMAPTWRDIADHVRPVKQNVAIESATDFTETPNNPRIAALFDTTGVESNLTYAAGCMSWMTPSETHWFSFDAPMALSEYDEIKRWYGIVTEETRRIMALSNFYSQIHEVWLDDGAFATSGMMAEEGAGGLRFEALQIGDYAILEDDNRRVDTVFRDIKLTVRQAAQKFGERALHPEMRKILEENGRDCDKRYEFLHCIMPREDSDRIAGMIDPMNMPWASIYIDKKNRMIVQEGGQWENPACVHRHLLWSHSPYGFGPGFTALPDCRQLNFMQQYLDTLVEKQVSPPVLLPAGYEGGVDLRADGVTYFEDEARLPRHWQNPGNYMVGEDRTVFRQGQIRKAFHVDLFQALASVPVGKEMTAMEVMARQRDRLTLFSPTFARKNEEIITPIMRRVFAILLRAGAYPQPPMRLLQQRPDGLAYIPDPEIVYTSRLALQIKAIHNESFSRTLGMLAPLFEMVPGILDHFDFDKATRGIARNEGVREDWLRPERQVFEIQEARAEAQQQAEDEASALAEADSVAKLSSSGAIKAE